eukprot:CAMPEP_0168508386 /NCGR_PEP_ID=MMETSP0405-20121227/89_1 /TAXON_ID=498012 /ORGANISM="Trichosphaerium sp, Strain Am-I-7 wt" /LENGTH=308 /DNA_ID=CAMNT_0008525523 /DNA_START=94 /DNA_END=1023 /DNA_ORIENTATION=+
MPWFLTLYIGYIPMQATLRVLDRFFFAGAQSLFQAGLALLKMNGDRMMETDDGYHIVVILKENTSKADEDSSREFLKIAFEEFDGLDLKPLAERKYLHKSRIIKEVEANSKRGHLQNLQSTTKLSAKELTYIYDYFLWSQDLLNSGEEDLTVDRELFDRLLINLCPALGGMPEVLAKLFKMAAHDVSQTVSLHEFARWTSPLLRGTLKEKFKVCFLVYAKDESDCATQVQTLNILELLLAFYQHVELDVFVFVQMVFDRLGEAEDGTVSYKQLHTELIINGLLRELFQLKVKRLRPRTNRKKRLANTK